MNWTTAWLTMKQGHKVKRRGWKNAYWHISGTELLIHKEDGEEANFRKVKDMGMMLTYYPEPRISEEAQHEIKKIIWNERQKKAKSETDKKA